MYRNSVFTTFIFKSERVCAEMTTRHQHKEIMSLESYRVTCYFQFIADIFMWSTTVHANQAAKNEEVAALQNEPTEAFHHHLCICSTAQYM